MHIHPRKAFLQHLAQTSPNPMALHVVKAEGNYLFDENKDDGDTEVTKRGVNLIVDPMSIQYLMGAEIDFQEDLQGARFVIKNPNATTTCSCGSSFS